MKAQTYKTLTNPWHFLAMGFGSGLSPRAPGTAGSIVALLVWLAVPPMPWPLYAGLMLVATASGIWLCDHVARELGVKDPACIVFDEFVGVWIALFMVPAGWYWVLSGLLLFRVLDIAKPWPISWLDRRLPGGWGIMLDDVAAGLISLAILQGVAYGLAQF